MPISAELLAINHTVTEYLTTANLVESHEIAKILLNYSHSATFDNQQELVWLLVDIFAAAKSKPTAALTELKTAICNLSDSTNWKTALLKSKLRQPYLSAFFSKLQFSNDATHAITAQLANRTVTASLGGIATLLGSTFSTNRSSLITSEQHVLDAIYSCHLYNSDGKVDGAMLAVADGCGGHFGDSRQDRNISRAAHFSTKEALRQLGRCQRPKDFWTHLDTIFTAVINTVKHKAVGESTTLLAARAFLVGRQYLVVGFNLGDCLLCGWHPQKKQFLNIAPAQVSEAGTAQLPDSWRAHEIYRIHKYVPQGTRLIALSDGIVDMLPQRVNEATYPNGLAYRTTYLDESKMTELLSDLPTDCDDEALLQCITLAAFENAEKERHTYSHQDAMFQIGDDVAISVVALPNKTWSETIKYSFR